MANASDPARLTSPRMFLVRMLVFLVLCGLIAFVLQRQIINAFNANPWLNGLILAVLLIGLILIPAWRKESRRQQSQMT